MRVMTVAGGTLETGPGWERDGETSLVRRPLRVDVRLARAAVVSPPMRHLSVNVLAESPGELLRRLRSKLCARVPQLRMIAEGAFEFADGVAGEFFCVEMEVFPGMRTRQLHVVRADLGVARHFVATVAGPEAAAIDFELRPMIASFRAVARRMAV